MTTTDHEIGTFSAAEREAMKERAAELRAEKTQGRGAKKREADEHKLRDLIDTMPEGDATLTERVWEIVRTVAPELDAKTWYGMPAWARDGKIVLFFQHASKFDARYATLGFEGEAALDDGLMWPTSFAVTGLDAATEQRIADLVKQAVA